MEGKERPSWDCALYEFILVHPSSHSSLIAFSATPLFLHYRLPLPHPLCSQRTFYHSRRPLTCVGIEKTCRSCHLTFVGTQKMCRKCRPTCVGEFRRCVAAFLQLGPVFSRRASHVIQTSLRGFARLRWTTGRLHSGRMLRLSKQYQWVLSIF